MRGRCTMWTEPKQWVGVQGHHIGQTSAQSSSEWAKGKCSGKDLLSYPPACTTELHVVDAGVGVTVTTHMGQLLDSWLEADENLEKWTSGEPPACELGMGEVAHGS